MSNLYYKDNNSHDLNECNNINCNYEYFIGKRFNTRSKQEG